MNKNQILTQIAKKHCFVPTLESRGCDDYDFHDIGVRNLKAAMEEAFEAGRTSVKFHFTDKDYQKFLEQKSKENFDPTDEIYWK